MTIDEYLFWSQVNCIANNLDNLTEYRENEWIKNFSFKEKLNVNLKIINNLLENKCELKIKLKKR